MPDVSAGPALETASPALPTLQHLLDTKQATAILPGQLYFASTGEGFASQTSPSSLGALSASTVTALEEFFSKDIPPCCDSGANSGTGEAAPTAAGRAHAIRAAVGRDAIFISLGDAPPYLYRRFFADFGPLDVGCCVHFARRLTELLRVVTGVDVSVTAAAAGRASEDGNAGTGSPPWSAGSSEEDGTGASPRSSSPLHFTEHDRGASDGAAATAIVHPVVICASLDAQERVNTACLVGAFCILSLGWGATTTWYRAFAGVYPGFLAYRDASQGVSNYPLSLLNVWQGLEQGVAAGLVNVRTFDLPAFWEGKRLDYSWVVPRRLMAMSSPQDDHPARTAEKFGRRLRRLGVRLVVRLNDNLYDPAPLLRLGIRHIELPYPDGSVPSDATLLRFLNAVERHFGEVVTPAPLRPCWSASSSETAVARRPRSAGVAEAPKRAASAGTSMKGAPGAHHRHPVLQPCSLLHSGACRGMPHTGTAALPSPPKPRHTGGAKRSAAAEWGTLAPGDPGAVAVHCLAGLGRTGTMLAVYLMRHYGFSARAVIGWLRLCRPGSITGIQQQYLDAMERRLRPSPHILAAMQMSGPAARVPGADAGSGADPHTSLLAWRTHARPSSAEGFMPATRPATRAREQRSGSGSGGSLRDALVTSYWPARGDRSPKSMLPPAGVVAFQTHGSVVADARPSTATVSVDGHIKGGIGGSGRVTLSAGGGGSNSGCTPVSSHPLSETDGDGDVFSTLALWKRRDGRISPNEGPLVHHAGPQHPVPHRSSMVSNVSTLSFNTLRQETPPLDAMSRMPLLGDTAEAARRRSVTMMGERRLSATHSSPERASPCATDYAYASTYFVALEMAAGGFLPQHPPPSPLGDTVGGESTTVCGVPGGTHRTPSSQSRPTNLPCAPHTSVPRFASAMNIAGLSRPKKISTRERHSSRIGLGVARLQRPHSAMMMGAATAVTVPITSRSRFRQCDVGDRRSADVSGNSESGLHLHDTPLPKDAARKKHSTRPPLLLPPRPTAVTRGHRGRDDKASGWGDLEEDAMSFDGSSSGKAVLRVPRPPQQPLSSAMWDEQGALMPCESTSSSSQQQQSVPSVATVASLPLWGRPMVYT